MHVSPLVAHLSISLCCMSVACAFLFCTSSLFLTVYVGCATEAGMEGVHLQHVSRTDQLALVARG